MSDAAPQVGLNIGHNCVGMQALVQPDVDRTAVRIVTADGKVNLKVPHGVFPFLEIGANVILDIAITQVLLQNADPAVGSKIIRPN